MPIEVCYLEDLTVLKIVHEDYSHVPDIFNAKHVILTDFANYGR